MNWWTVASVAVVLATPTVLGLYDGAAYEIAGNDSTLSRVCQLTAWAHPLFQVLVCFLLAVLCGHIFTTFPHEPPIPRWLSLAVFVALPYLVVIVSMILEVETLQTTVAVDAVRNHPMKVTIASLIAGALIGGGLLHQTA